jgi:hypothetical protein
MTKKSKYPYKARVTVSNLYSMKEAKKMSGHPGGNPYHVPNGPNGGQFTSGPGGSSHDEKFNTLQKDMNNRNSKTPTSDSLVTAARKGAGLPSGAGSKSDARAKVRAAIKKDSKLEKEAAKKSKKNPYNRK